MAGEKEEDTNSRDNIGKENLTDNKETTGQADQNTGTLKSSDRQRIKKYLKKEEYIEEYIKTEEHVETEEDISEDDPIDTDADILSLDDEKEGDFFTSGEIVSKGKYDGKFLKIFELGKRTRGREIEFEIDELSEEFFDSGKHLILTDTDAFREISKRVKFPRRTFNESTDARQYPNVEFYDNLLFMTLNDLCWGEGSSKITSREVNIFLGRNNLMIVHHGFTKSLESMTERIDHSDLYRALYSFLDAMLDSDRKIINEVENKALKLEDRILKHFQVENNDDRRTLFSKNREPGINHDLFMEQIVKLRKHLSLLKKYVEPTADVMEILEADESDLIPAEYDKYFMKLSLKADRAVQGLVNLRDYIAQVRESWQAHVDLQFNKVMKFFTVATTIFLPLTLITGWYGMNFQYMPELYWKYSYPAVFLICVFIVAGCIWWFKKRKYI